MSQHPDTTVQLKPRQIEYLEEMVAKYNLPDSSKAVRCLIDYSCENHDKEQAIFADVHCLDC